MMVLNFIMWLFERHHRGNKKAPLLFVMTEKVLFLIKRKYELTPIAVLVSLVEESA